MLNGIFGINIDRQRSLVWFTLLAICVACGRVTESEVAPAAHDQKPHQEVQAPEMETSPAEATESTESTLPVPPSTESEPTASKPAPKPVPKPTPQPVPVPPEALNPVSKPAGKEVDRLHAASPWAHVSGSKAWTNAVIKLIRRDFAKLNQARDKNEFCPGYVNATKTQKEICWLRIIGGIVKFESGFRPRLSFREANGTYSVGLMMLSAGECSNAPTMETLKDPVRNLTCGVGILSRLVAKDGFIGGPPSARGAAAYWSVLRPPYSAHGYKLGKRDKIIAISKTFKNH